MDYLGLNISYLVGKTDLSKDDFGELFGLKIGTIGSYTNNNIKPKIETLQKISAKFNILIDDLINKDISKDSGILMREGKVEDLQVANDPEVKGYVCTACIEKKRHIEMMCRELQTQSDLIVTLKKLIGEYEEQLGKNAKAS